MPRNKKKGNRKGVEQPEGENPKGTSQAQTESQNPLQDTQPGPSVEGAWEVQGRSQQKNQRRNMQLEEKINPNRQTHPQQQESRSFHGKMYSNPSSRGGYSQRGRGRGYQQPNSREQPRRPQQESQSQEKKAWDKPRSWQATSSQDVLPKRQSELNTTTTISTTLQQPQTSDIKKISVQKIGGGTAGRRIIVETNHIRIDFGVNEQAYHYDVEIEPNRPKKFLCDVFEEIRRKHFPKNHPGFDGMKNMVTPYQLLKADETLSDVIEIQIPNKSKRDSFKVSIKLAAVIDLRSLRNVEIRNNQQAVQCAEIVLRSSPAMRSIPAGRSFFNPSQVIKLGGGKEIYCGFYQSISRGWKQYFFNIDVAHKVFPTEMNVVDLIAEMASNFKQRVTPEDLTRRNPPQYVLDKVQDHLKGLSILYELPGMKRQYRVNGLGMSAKDEVFKEDGRTTTVENYFKMKKNRPLRYPTLPTVWVGNVQRDDKILLPAELCTIVKNQTVHSKLTDDQKTQMIRKTATSTIERKKKIMDSLREARHNEDACMKEFGFQINNAFEKIEARVLAPPRLKYDKGEVSDPRKGAWRQNGAFLKGAEAASWVIISLCGNKGRECADFANTLSKLSRQRGVRLDSERGPFDCIQKDRPIFADIQNILRKHSKYQLIFVIIENKNQYASVKKAAEINMHCLTQCILAKTLFKMDTSTAENILLKVNSKLNGINHCLNVKPNILEEPCMIMGADVTHPGPLSKNIPSVAAVTATYDPTAYFGYNIRCTLQPPKEEIILDLEEITKDFLLSFYQRNNQQKPRKIIMFRDGVSEGQFETVKSRELAAIQKACRKLQPEYEPKITFVTVQKRHHTRFFPRQEDSEDRNCNVPAGTVVDTVITNPEHHDFYLVSQASIQGVAKPTKYTTLYDDNDLSYDEIEQLAFYLCHLYSRCNRSVGYPAPTYYAHLAAARAKVYIESDMINLDDLGKEQRKIKNDKIRETNPMFFV